MIEKLHLDTNKTNDSSDSNLIITEGLKDILSTINIWVQTWWNIEKITENLIWFFENNGFSCIKIIKNELFFQNKDQILHIILVENGDFQVDLYDKLSIERTALLKALDFENNVDILKNTIGGYQEVKEHYEKKITRKNINNWYHNKKYTKSAHNPKNSGRNFKKIK